MRKVVTATVATVASVGLFVGLKSEHNSPEFSVETVPAFLLANSTAELQQQAAIAADNIAPPSQVVIPKPEVALDVIHATLVPRLGEFGLKLFTPEEGVNGDNEFMVKINDRCGSQVAIEQPPEDPNLFNLRLTNFGRLHVLEKFKRYIIPPERTGLLAHEEQMDGKPFNPGDEQSVGRALVYLADETKRVCARQGLLGRR